MGANKPITTNTIERYNSLEFSKLFGIAHREIKKKCYEAMSHDDITSEFFSQHTRPTDSNRDILYYRFQKEGLDLLIGNYGVPKRKSLKFLLGHFNKIKTLTNTAHAWRHLEEDKNYVNKIRSDESEFICAFHNEHSISIYLTKTKDPLGKLYYLQKNSKEKIELAGFLEVSSSKADKVLEDIMDYLSVYQINGLGDGWYDNHPLNPLTTLYLHKVPTIKDKANSIHPTLYRDIVYPALIEVVFEKEAFDLIYKALDIKGNKRDIETAIRQITSNKRQRGNHAVFI
jgi:phage regulator Rha-like protein